MSIQLNEMNSYHLVTNSNNIKPKIESNMRIFANDNNKPQVTSKQIASSSEQREQNLEPTQLGSEDGKYILKQEETKAIRLKQPLYNLMAKPLEREEEEAPKLVAMVTRKKTMKPRNRRRECCHSRRHQMDFHHRGSLEISKPIKMLATTFILLATCYTMATSSSSSSSSSGSNPMATQQQVFRSSQTTDSAATKTYLLDTTEQSSLGWTKYPDGGPQTRTPGWVEESFTNFESGINWRSFVVCDVAFNSVNNWLWTPFIERGDANRLHIEIKFTMRDCNLFPQKVLSCKETFGLLYKEVDEPISQQQAAPSLNNNNNNSSQASGGGPLPQLDSYTVIGTIAADEGRFTSNNDVVINTEIRSIPVSKRGVYFAFRDQGACLSLISIKVYHQHCPQQLANLARFNATPTGPDLTSLVAAEGVCVPNSIQVEQPKMFCSADGQWNTMTSGQCRCQPGFEPAANNTKCQPCPYGKFKPSAGELACQTCPEHSSAPALGSTECRCHEGYFRAHKDPRAAPCTQPPGPPSNLSATHVDSNTVVLQWQAPRIQGQQQQLSGQQRDDLTYRLVCDQCDQLTMVSSPPFLTNFSETKCVLGGLMPGTIYRFLVYAMNGVSQLASSSPTTQTSGPQFSEITIQTQRPVIQTNANTLSSGQGGFQLMPIYNFRALAGARGSDMLLAWDAQPFETLSTNPGDSQDLAAAAASQPLPSLYEIRYQPRYLIDPAATSNQQRRSPYPPSLMSPPPQPIDHPNQINIRQQQAQSVTTTSRAMAITGLSPRTDYAFQIRAKWAHTNQWTDYSEPIYMATSNQLVPVANPSAPFGGGSGQDIYLDPVSLLDPTSRLPQAPFIMQQQSNNQQQTPNSSPSSWLSTLALGLLCTLILLAFISVSLIHYRKSMCMQSLGAGFGNFGGGGGGSSGPGSTYGGIYGAGVGVGQLASGYGNPLGLHNHHHHAQHNHHHHHATMSASSAGGLITGSNGTSRSSSSGGGTGNVVQNFIAATLSQISGGSHAHNHHHHQHHHPKTGPLVGPLGNHHTMGQLGDGKSFVAPGQLNSIQAHHQQHQRNHYHQTLGGPTANNHTLLLGVGAGSGNGSHTNSLNLDSPSAALLQQHQQQQHLNHSPITLLTNSGLQQQQPAGGDLFKFRTLIQPQQGAAQYIQQDPQMHIYDDLENTTCSSLNPQANGISSSSPAATTSNEIEPHRVSIESVVGRGEFGDVCLANLKSSITGAEKRVSVKTLGVQQANEKAKLDFLVEATILSQFEHPNIVHLEGVVTKGESFMIVTEFMENGSLDSYLRDNRNRFTCLQLISMLRGVASGMQHLEKLNYVHKDLAARNILVNGQNVCKIADFGLSAHQFSSADTNTNNGQADYTPATTTTTTTSNDSTSTNSSNTLSSQTTGSTPTTATSTIAGSSNLTHLQSVADQLVQQRFATNQQQLLSSTLLQQPPTPIARTNQNAKIPVRWTALEVLAFRRFTSASDVWSFGIVCWEVMTEGERPYWSWSNQDVIKAVEQGYRLPQPDNCPDQLYKMMLDCWLKDRAARPNFSHLLKTLDRLLSPYDDPFCQLPPSNAAGAVVSPANLVGFGQSPPPQHQQPQLVPMQTRISNQEPAYYDTYISQLVSNKSNLPQQQKPSDQPTVDEWLNSIRMSRYKENFQRHQINSLPYVARLSQADLNLIGIHNNQHTKKILNAIQALRSTSSIGASGEGYLV